MSLYIEAVPAFDVRDDPTLGFTNEREASTYIEYHPGSNDVDAFIDGSFVVRAKSQAFDSSGIVVPLFEFACHLPYLLNLATTGATRESLALGFSVAGSHLDRIYSAKQRQDRMRRGSGNNLFDNDFVQQLYGVVSSCATVTFNTRLFILHNPSGSLVPTANELAEIASRVSAMTTAINDVFTRIKTVLSLARQISNPTAPFTIAHAIVSDFLLNVPDEWVDIGMQPCTGPYEPDLDMLPGVDLSLSSAWADVWAEGDGGYV